MKRQRLVLLLAVIAVTCTQSLFAQQLGYPPFGSFQVGNFDGVNLQDLNVTFSLPVISSSGRGINFQLPIAYNSIVWTKSGTLWIPSTNWGWQTNLPQGQFIGGLLTHVTFKCYNPGPGWFWSDRWTYGGYAYTDPAGTVHLFPISITIDNCWGDSGTYSGYALDGSGYYGSTDINYNLVVKGPAGNAPGASSITDSNGNYITQTVNGSETDYKDSVGRTAAKVIANTTSIQYKFLDGTGTNTYQIATLTLTSTPIKTNFACSGIGEYTGSTYLPTELDIPSPSGSTLKYIFAYEPTPGNSGYWTGRLQKVTLPTSGTYEYDYGATNDGMDCTSGAVVSMTRKVTDGLTVGTWQYVRTVQGSSWLDTVTDAAGNDTVYTSGYPSGVETERQMYSGSGGSRTGPLRTIVTGWGANGTPAYQTTTLEDGKTMSQVNTAYDSNGLLDSVSEYDWGQNAPGSLLRTTTYSYLNSSNYTSRNIINRVTSKVVKDGSGTIKYRQDTGYDETAVTCFTGVTQHDDTDFPCSMNYRGNPTSVTTYLDPVTPAQGVKSTLAYDVFGNALTQSLAGSQQMQANFSTATEYAYPDSVVTGLSSGPQLTSNFTYYGDTGQIETVKDPNNQQTSYVYDFLRRLKSVTRPDNSQITETYNDSLFTSDVATPIDSSRSMQRITAFDQLGLPYTTTIEDSSDTVYSIVQTSYDPMGRAYRTSTPYTSSPSWTTISFDALSRPVTITDPGNGTTVGTLSYTYSLNDVEQTLGPKPSGDSNTKRRQMEYDGSGRLTSVCEITGASGSGSCAQRAAQTGYWTQYTYNVLDELLHVTQNAQSSPQATRTYAYDAAGRMTSETNPELGQNGFGTIYYTYDSDASCGFTSTGDLVKKIDPAGTVSCMAYDGLHRITSATYGSGLASNTANRYFTYDAAVVNGNTMQNAKGRLAEASTGGPISIQNPGFESSGSLPPPGWTANYATLSYDTTTQYAGVRSLKTSATTQWGGVLGPQQTGIPGKQYTISGYVKGDGTCNPEVQLMFLNSSGSYLNGAQAWPGAPTSWTYTTATVTAPTGTAYIQISLQNNTAGGSGVCEYDNVAASSNINVTDVGLSYNTLGQLADLWESSPNSGGYHHTTATYWGTGAPETLSEVGGSNYANTYLVDGIGRVTSTSNGNLTNTTYNVANEPLQINYGSGDNDSFTYDPSLRINKYTYNVGSHSVVGTPSWNANGTVGSLSITDPFDNSNAQTCSYSYDDLRRIAGANCGSIWSQNFTYDPFGNLTKTGTSSFNAAYTSSPQTNHITQVGSSTPTYDANGNVTNDFLNTYTWDANGLATTVNAVALTRDALGRVVERNTGGTTTQVEYAPDGFAMQMITSGVYTAFVPLPGGAEAVWVGSSVHYRHPDGLGSARLTSGATFGDVAYGPFGESYATSGTPDLTYTGIDQDTSANVYDFPAREYGVQGRWPSPDPAGLSTVDPTNPQSWNRYAYVDNDPLNLTDPTGLCPEWGPVTEFVGVNDPRWAGHIGYDPTSGYYQTCRQTNFSGFGLWYADFAEYWNPGGWEGPNYDIFIYAPTSATIYIGSADPTGGGNQDKRSGLLCDPDYINASKKAWQRSGNGSSTKEAGFWTVGLPSGDTMYVPLPYSNEDCTITHLSPPAGTQALTHVHPSGCGGSLFSPSDQTYANQATYPWYVISPSGQGVFTEGGNNTAELIDPGVTWMQPCASGSR